jgi:hypothetical protein
MGSGRKPQGGTMLACRRQLPDIAAAIALGGLALFVSACSGFGPGDTRAGLSCIDDSPECVDRRQATLQAMLADPERRWVREPSSAHAHASGVRLFAFRSRKKELTCEELAIGRREADSVPKSLRGAKELSPAQVSRASMFASEVGRELAAEMRARRCRA